MAAPVPQTYEQQLDLEQFGPDLQNAFADYCRLPAAVGKPPGYGSNPKMTQANFLRLCQDINLMAPEGELADISMSWKHTLGDRVLAGQLEQCWQASRTLYIIHVL